MNDALKPTTLDGDRSFDFECSIQVSNSWITLSQSSILYLEIKESIFNGFPEGVILLDNNTGTIDNVFTFSGDSTVDLIYFSIKPTNQKDEQDYKIEEIFSIYKIEDMPVGEYPQGAKKLFFRNVFANEMRLKKNSLTVQDFFGDTDISNFSDNERAVKTGDILKKIFGKDNQSKDLPRTGDFKINEEQWDVGKYSMYPNWCSETETLFESIQKVYLKHISAKEPYDKCYLKYDRFKKELSLISLSELLLLNKNDSLNYFIESLVMGSMGSGEKDPSDKGGDGGTRPIVASGDTLLDVSNIRSFKLYDLSSDIIDKDFIISIPAITDFNNTTRLNLGEVNIKEEIFKDYEKHYVKDPFMGRVKGGEPLSPILWQQFRKKLTTQYNKVIDTPYKSWDHAYDVEVRANILSLLLFKGLNCTLSLRGATHRTAGKFIDIENKEAYKTNKFTKIPGRWLVTECSHIFTKDKYWNSLNCIKTYRNF